MTCALRRRLDRDENGFSLIEVMVAMLIFAFVSIGLVYTMLMVTTMGRDGRNRQVAANLAAEEIDLVRATGDLFALVDRSRTIPLGTDTYTLERRTQWVTDPDVDIACGSSGTSQLRYKRVNVTVTWPNMRNATAPVRADTVVQPKDKINDPAKGTIVVTVMGGGGTGVAGVGVTATPATPSAGAAPLASTPAATDAQGCSYILRVVPGNYDVKVSKANFVDVRQAATATELVTVNAGEAVSVQFQYDERGTFNLSYGGNYTPAAGEVLRVPLVPVTSFTNTYDTYVVTPPSAATPTRTVNLYPFSTGYEAFVGTCQGSDPAEWPAVSKNGYAWKGERPPGIAALPGDSVTAAVHMGVVKLALGPLAGDVYLRAVSAPAPSGSDDPGCATSTTYAFGPGAASKLPADGNVTVALPYGSWRLFYGTGNTVTGWTSTVPGARMSLPASAVPSLSEVRGDVVTLDPRTVETP